MNASIRRVGLPSLTLVTRVPVREVRGSLDLERQIAVVYSSVGKSGVASTGAIRAHAEAVFCA